MGSLAGWRKSGRSEMVAGRRHNMHNGLMAIAAARHVGVAPQMPLTRWVRLLTLVAVWSCG